LETIGGPLGPLEGGDWWPIGNPSEVHWRPLEAHWSPIGNYWRPIGGEKVLGPFSSAAAGEFRFLFVIRLQDSYLV